MNIPLLITAATLAAIDGDAMPVFAELIAESGGKSIHYKGKEIFLVDHIEIPPHSTLVLKIYSYDNHWRQGVMIRSSRGSSIQSSGRDFGDLLVVWANDERSRYLVQLIGRDRVLSVRNVWDTGNGTVQSWHNGAGMFKEVGSGETLYHCNDARPNDDLSDIVFGVQVQMQ
jgi:hypothetical protein